MDITIEWEFRKLKIVDTITYINSTDTSLNEIVLLDWNHAFSSIETPLGKRFSDEFVRNFMLSKSSDKGYTSSLNIKDINNNSVNYSRNPNQQDVIDIILSNKLEKDGVTELILEYEIRLPSNRFTGYGWDASHAVIKDFLITPAIYNSGWLAYSNLNIHDAAWQPFWIEGKVNIVNNGILLNSNLPFSKHKNEYQFNSFAKQFELYIAKGNVFEVFKNELIEVHTSLEISKTDYIQRAIAIDRVTRFINSKYSRSYNQKIIISQEDYERNPFYGIKQLPRFLAPFSDEFIYELKFLKAYTQKYLEDNLRVNIRKDGWILDALQVYCMMEYINQYYPETKMTGKLSNFPLFKRYHVAQLDFNEQYYYLYMLMIRKNHDQPLHISKDALIKFNNQIANKYKAGSILHYFASQYGNSKIENALSNFYNQNTSENYAHDDFVFHLKKATDYKITEPLNLLSETRNIPDYKIRTITSTKDSIEVNLRRKSGESLPVPIHLLKQGKVIDTTWIYAKSKDTILRFDRKNADHVSVNYYHEMPELSLRNNTRSVNKYAITHRPLRFTLFKDFENPKQNQILYVPTFAYNLYDGITPGIQFSNKTLLDRPLQLEINPTYSSLTKQLIGNLSMVYYQYNRNSNWYQTRYSLQGSTYHYAPDASYYRFNPMVIFRHRNQDLRDNTLRTLLFRYVAIDREKTDYVIINEDNKNYSVANARYVYSSSELLKFKNLKIDVQIANIFGKTSIEYDHRHMFLDGRTLSIRGYAGTFLYRKTDAEYFYFGIDRPTDYMFDYGLYGRSETEGLFSQQFVQAEGAFKSRYDTRYANEWITSLNTHYTIWNWIDAYTDIGMYKNHNSSVKGLYGMGIRLNLITDYFEIYFPIYSNNGWEFSNQEYHKSIRAVVTLNPNVLLGLFTRKWL